MTSSIANETVDHSKNREPFSFYKFITKLSDFGYLPLIIKLDLSKSLVGSLFHCVYLVLLYLQFSLYFFFRYLFLSFFYFSYSIGYLDFLSVCIFYFSFNLIIKFFLLTEQFSIFCCTFRIKLVNFSCSFCLFIFCLSIRMRKFICLCNYISIFNS